LAGKRVEALVEHHRKDGTVFPVEVRAGLLEIEGHKYILAFDRDVTVRNQTEEALQRSRQLAVVGQMAAGLAHEIKNPLAGIKVSMEVLMNELTLSPEDKAIFVRTVGEVQRIESLLKNLLNYARTPQPVFCRLDLNQQLENAVKNALLLLKSADYAAAGSKELEFVRNLDPALPRIMADPGQMQQVILNLLLNAMEATPEGGTITLSTKPGREGTVEVAVADTGKGMSEEARAKIFQPFYTTKPKGSGLGLAITRRLVEQHRGEIEVAGVLGQGTTFTITLPIDQIDQNNEDEKPC
jgi:two-component system sensor histidine kinase AtoS